MAFTTCEKCLYTVNLITKKPIYTEDMITIILTSSLEKKSYPCLKYYRETRVLSIQEKPSAAIVESKIYKSIGLFHILLTDFTQSETTTASSPYLVSVGLIVKTTHLFLFILLVKEQRQPSQLRIFKTIALKTTALHDVTIVRWEERGYA